MVNIGNDWDELLKDEFSKDYYKELRKFLIEEYRNGPVYPEMHDIFNALRCTSYEDTKVVILGQDPYHEPGQAHGLAFSVQKGVRWPPSLMNMLRELRDDTGIDVFTDEVRKKFSGREKSDGGHEGGTRGCLSRWADQGVLLLNTTLTVRAHKAGSHRGHGWEILTDRIIELLNDHERPIVFILWGRNARDKKSLITNPKHLILEGVHPSPLSANRGGFFGGRYYSRTNKFLEENGMEPIDWNLI